MKKIRDYENVQTLADTDLANVFNVYEDSNLGPQTLSFNINRTFNFIGQDEYSKTYLDQYYVMHGDTWTTIAYKVHNNSRLWWLVCKANNIADPSIQPVRDTKIYVLKNDYVNQVLALIRDN